MIKNNTKFVRIGLAVFLILTFYVFVSCLIIILVGNNNDYSKYVLNEINEKYPIIIIDPGHGGIDGGAVSQSGVVEKDINLNIAKYIYEYFRLSDVECVLTRDADIMLEAPGNVSANKKKSDLLARVKIASEYQNSIFVSIHQNFFPNSKYNGLQVFYSKNNYKSEIIAETIRLNTQKYLQRNNEREIKPAGREIYVLDSLEIPAVLIECGFLSNVLETEKLSSPEYQKKIAFMIYISLMEYITENQNNSI